MLDAIEFAERALSDSSLPVEARTDEVLASIANVATTPVLDDSLSSVCKTAGGAGDTDGAAIGSDVGSRGDVGDNSDSMESLGGSAEDYLLGEGWRSRLGVGWWTWGVQDQLLFLDSKDIWY